MVKYKTLELLEDFEFNLMFLYVDEDGEYNLYTAEELDRMVMNDRVLDDACDSCSKAMKTGDIMIDLEMPYSTKCVCADCAQTIVGNAVSKLLGIKVTVRRMANGAMQ